MLSKIQDYLSEHIKGTFLLVIVCILTLCTAVSMLIPSISNLTKYNQIIESLGGEKNIVFQKETTSSEKQDIFAVAENKNSTSPTKITDTKEYQASQDEIQKKQRRINDLDNDLMITVYKSASDFFVNYNEYITTQTPVNLERMKQFMTDKYYDDTFKYSSPEKDVCIVECIRFADFDKDTILAYVQLKNSKIFLLSYVNDSSKGWVINKIQKI